MKQTTFSAVGINQNFVITGGLVGSDQVWCNKIDDARYIEIGKNGAYIPDRDMIVFIENK